jgi:phosphoserine phosphatase
MIKFFLLILIFTCQAFAKPQKNITFIFDFDFTLYQKRDKKGYLDYLYQGYFANQTVPKYQQVYTKQAWLEKNLIYLPQNNNLFLDFLKTNPDLDLRPKEKLVQETIKTLKLRATQGLPQIIKGLIDEGYQVLVIGGFIYGCAIIPEFAKMFNIPAKNIYSGYFTNFSDQELVKPLKSKFQYSNCGNSSLTVPYTMEKSEVIRFLKSKGIIKNKVVHIGDGLNDLEVLQAKEADVFIGFGLTNYIAEVEKESSIYVDNLKEFKEALEESKKRLS